MKKGKKIAIIIAIILSGMIAYVAWQVWASENCLIVNEYQCDTGKLSEAIQMVVLSDLHGHEFGEKNEKLVKYTAEQSPDIILLAGDFVNNYSENSDIACELIRNLKEIAPVYFAMGNHELEYMETGKIQLQAELEAAGAIVLDKEYVDIEINDERIRIGGLYDYAFGSTPDENLASAAPEDTKLFLEDFQNADALKIMMSHRPDSFIFGDAASYWDIDLVVSGHDHGGQVVLPFLGGVFGGDQGYFPEYVHGLYQKEEIQLFVTSGLGTNRKILPRFNNKPEIAVITCT